MLVLLFTLIKLIFRKEKKVIYKISIGHLYKKASILYIKTWFYFKMTH